MASDLDKVNTPDDLKKLSDKELKALAHEIRDKIVEVVSKTGGHLAPSLGAVELTLGLLLALNPPKDKIVWDVGHQCYVYKILTGRKDQFETLRQYQGICGFPRKQESEYDIFNSGHASTSISVALGLAEARDKRGGDETIVAVIGDGALTGGIAYEALNQAGHLKTPLIVILNDNEMSIANNVGAMSSYLSRIRLDPAYNKMEQEIEHLIKNIPGIGETMYEVGGRIKDSLKQLVVPGMLFEELGFKYIGPIDGHNIAIIKRGVTLAKEVKRPVLIHVLTQKGKGYKPAETQPEKFHGTSAFVVKNGESKQASKIPSYTEVFGQTMIELAEKNPQIVCITAAMPAGTGLSKFAKKYPDRFYDVGIAEQHAVTFGAGLALDGLKPVVAIYSTFLERAFDQIIQDVALQELNVTLAVDRGGLVGEDGPTHHGAFDLTYLRHIPNLIVAAPKDEEELRQLLFTAVNVDSPMAVRYPRGCGLGVQISQDYKQLDIGKGEILREGNQVALIAIGRMVKVAQDAAELLDRKGISSAVVNSRFVKPLDEELVCSVCKTKELIVTLEDNTKVGGFGSAILELLNEEHVNVPIIRIGLPDRFITHGSVNRLFEEIGLTAEKVTARVEKELTRDIKEYRVSRTSYINKRI